MKRYPVVLLTIFLIFASSACTAVLNVEIEQPADEALVATRDALVTENARLSAQLAAILTPTPIGAEQAPADATPVPIQWAVYSDPHLQVRLHYPAGWQPIPGYGEDESGERYGGEDGFFQVDAVSSSGRSIEQTAVIEAEHRLQPYGSRPRIVTWVVDGQEAKLILPSKDQPQDMDDQACLIVRYPEPITLSGQRYEFFVLYADQEHISAIARSVRFTQASSDAPGAGSVVKPLIMGDTSV